MIYFVKSPAGSIKIGTTIRLSHRLRQLAAAHGPGLEVLAVLDGSFEVERALHDRFAHLRREGEWFEPGPDLTAFIAAEGRPWKKSDDESLGSPVKLDACLLTKVGYVAAALGQTPAEYIEEIVRPLIERDMAAEWWKVASTA